MPTPGVHLQTIQPPSTYTTAQIEQAAAIASAMHRGKLVLCEKPAR